MGVSIINNLEVSCTEMRFKNKAASRGQVSTIQEQTSTTSKQESYYKN